MRSLGLGLGLGRGRLPLAAAGGCNEGTVAPYVAPAYEIPLRENAAANNGSSTTASLSVSAWASESYGIVFITAVGNPTITSPSGFSELGSQAHPDDATLSLAVFGGEIGSHSTLSFPLSSSTPWVVLGVELSGIDGADALGAIALEGSDGQASPSKDFRPPTIEGVASDELFALAVVCADDDSIGADWWPHPISTPGALSTASNRDMRLALYHPYESLTAVQAPVHRPTKTVRGIEGVVFLRRAAGTRTPAAPDFQTPIEAEVGTNAGYAWLALQDGEEYVSGSGGWARRPEETTEASIAFDLDTKMHVASLSELITALAVMRLAQNAEIALSDAAYPYVSSRFPTHGTGVDTITIEHLLQQRAGITQDIDVVGDFETETQAYLDADVTYTPGEKFHYENGSYSVLEALIEAVTGEDYAQWCQDNILSPYCIEATTEVESPETLAYASGTDTTGHAFGNIPHRAAGGWIFSIRHYAKILRALRAGTIVSEEGLETMLLEEYGLFFQSNERGAMAQHNGLLRSGGASAHELRATLMRMTDGFDVVVFTNSPTGEALNDVLINCLTNT